MGGAPAGNGEPLPRLELWPFSIKYRLSPACALLFLLTPACPREARWEALLARQRALDRVFPSLKGGEARPWGDIRSA